MVVSVDEWDPSALQRLKFISILLSAEISALHPVRTFPWRFNYLDFGYHLNVPRTPQRVTMSIIRPFEATDILNFNSVNADAWTATVSRLSQRLDGRFTQLTN